MTYSRPLLELARDPAVGGLPGLWRALPNEQREHALALALEQRNPPWGITYLAEELAKKQGGFRPASIMKWAHERIAKAAIRHGADKPALVRQAIYALHLTERRDLQSSFLDYLGVAHTDGDPGDLPTPVASPTALATAAARLVSAKPDEAALYYLVALCVMLPDQWGGLGIWLHGFAETQIELASTADHDIAPSDTNVPRAVSPVGAPMEHQKEEEETVVGKLERAGDLGTRVVEVSARGRLTVLDNQITLAIVDAASGITGALSTADIDELIDELLHLNGRRHQTYYHVGFCDVLFGRSVAATLHADNESRWLWYFGGYLAGLARRHDTAAIMHLYDSHKLVRELGREGVGACAVAGPHVFRALCEAGRYAEAAHFVTSVAAYDSAQFQAELLEAGTELLRREEPLLAEPLLHTLWQALAERKANERFVSPLTWNDVRRRRAACLRFRGDIVASNALLLELLEDQDDYNRPAVLADLGLGEAGYGRLFELRFPAKGSDCAGICEALEKGKARFIEAASSSTPTRSHGHYVLGFQALLGGDAVTALPHLEQALAGFEARPEVYRGGNLLVRARLHLALAICHSMEDIVRLPKAGEWIADAIKAGESIPEYLVSNTVDALSLAGSEVASHAAEAILAAAGNKVLDALANSDIALKSRPIADAMMQRAQDCTRSIVARVKDQLLLLPVLLHQNRVEEAAATLDALEVAAQDGIEADAYLEVLENPVRYSPAWDVEDARWSAVRCHEARGNYVRAAGLLEREFHRVLASSDYDALGKAWELLDRLNGYPDLPAEVREALRARYEAEANVAPEPVTQVDRGHIRILVIGGNEVQARYDEAIRSELAEAAPNIQVEFIHSGWSSNWDVYASDVRRALAHTDAVVMIYLIRTEFGRKVRKMFGSKPWRGCGGKGKAAILRSIYAAANAPRDGEAGGS